MRRPVGKVNALWQDTLHRILDEFSEEKITRPSAVLQLAKLGIERDEIDEMLDNIEEGILVDKGLA